MTWEKFWSIIDRVRAKADMQDEASVKQFLYTELINLPQDELLGFDCAWQSYRNQANFPKMVAAAVSSMTAVRMTDSRIFVTG